MNDARRQPFHPRRSVLQLGAAASIVQSGLFFVIGFAALALGVGRFVEGGFSSLPDASLTAFRILCGAFVLIAILGVAITPAERLSIEGTSPALAAFGSAIAYLGHAGTIAYFSWWLLRTIDSTAPAVNVDDLAPIQWGVMFELVFVGGWVWIIAGVARADPLWPKGFLVLSVVKATSFWFTFLAFLINEGWMLVLGLGAVTFVAGPLWHLWIARLFARWANGEGAP